MQESGLPWRTTAASVSLPQPVHADRSADSSCVCAGTGYTVGGRGTPALTDACSDCIYPPPPPPPGDGYCSSNPCMNEARCISISGSRYVDGQRVSNTFLCTCVNGYTGRFCELEPEVDDCGSRPCQNGGRCVDGDDAFTCTCRSGFGGEDCSTAPTASQPTFAV